MGLDSMETMTQFTILKLVLTISSSSLLHITTRTTISLHMTNPSHIHMINQSHITISNSSSHNHIQIITITKVVKICLIQTMSVVVQQLKLNHNSKLSLMMDSVWTIIMVKRLNQVRYKCSQLQMMDSVWMTTWVRIRSHTRPNSKYSKMMV